MLNSQSVRQRTRRKNKNSLPVGVFAQKLICINIWLFRKSVFMLNIFTVVQQQMLYAVYAHEEHYARISYGHHIAYMIMVNIRINEQKKKEEEKKSKGNNKWEKWALDGELWRNVNQIVCLCGSTDTAAMILTYNEHIWIHLCDQVMLVAPFTHSRYKDLESDTVRLLSNVLHTLYVYFGKSVRIFCMQTNCHSYIHSDAGMAQNAEYMCVRLLYKDECSI